MKEKPEAQTGEGNAPRNDPNANYGMYEADRVAKAKAQPNLPSITSEGSAPRELPARLKPLFGNLPSNTRQQIGDAAGLGN